MGTNYYFRKKTIDPTRIETIVDSLNDEFKAMVVKYNEKLHGVFSEMGIDSLCEFDDYHTFVSPIDHSDYDIHVGKLSCGWKPLMQANEHFHSVATLTLWYEQKKMSIILSMNMMKLCHLKTISRKSISAIIMTR